jgi:hypothetical protein
MIFGRSIQLWQGLVQALVAAIVAVAAFAGTEVPAGVVATIVALIFAALGLIANQQTVGARSFLGIAAGPKA